MMMRAPGLRRRNVDLPDGHLPIVHGEIGQIVLIDGSARLRLLGAGAGAQEQGCGGECVSTSEHEVILTDVGQLVKLHGGWEPPQRAECQSAAALTSGPTNANMRAYE